MSDKGIETISKPEVKVEEVADSKVVADSTDKQDSQESKPDTLDKKPVNIAGTEGNEPDVTPEKLEPALALSTSKTEESEEKEEEDNVKGDGEDKPPPLPARRGHAETEGGRSSTAFPQKPENQLLKNLKEAFPTVEEKYVKAIIIASGGALESAFHALLFLSDPESGKDIELPSRPLLPTPSNEERSEQGRQSQMEQDEMLARRLDRKYNSSRRPRPPEHQGGHPGGHPGNPERYFDDNEEYGTKHRLRERQRRRASPMSAEEYNEIYGDDGWGQFVDKDLPELRVRANKSLEETAAKLNGWWSGISKKWYGDEEETKESNNRLGSELREDPPKKPERRRFNSFGARVDDDSMLESHGITLHNEEEDLEVPPQLRSKTPVNNSAPVTQTAYIDTPEHAQRKKWQPVPPLPMSTSPEKNGKSKSAEDDDFLLNSEDEL